VEMTVRGKTGKPKNRFSRFSTLSTALGNRYAIPTFPQLRRLFLSYKSKAKTEPCSQNQ
jgi:hypothetical protein